MSIGLKGFPVRYDKPWGVLKLKDTIISRRPSGFIVLSAEKKNQTKSSKMQHI